MTTTPQNPPKIFISYAHKDVDCKDALVTNLKPLLRGGLLTAWNDTQIQPGEKWHEAIMTALNEADVAVMIVSRDFLASDYIHEHEFNPLLAKDKLIWIAASACVYKYTPLKDIQCVNDPARPLKSLTQQVRQAEWVKIIDKIMAVIENP